MTILWYDSESFCETPISVGAYRYSEDAEIMIVTYAIDDGPVHALDLTAGDASLADLQALIDKADTIRIQNSNFDRVLHAANGVRIPVEKIDDTMVVALLHSLPGSLDKLCDVLKVPVDKAKDKEGKKLIQLFCKPRPKNMKIRRATRETHPEEWARFISYAKSDIEAMREVWERLPKWNYTALEREYWLLDQRINDRGVKADLDLATSALRAFARTKQDLNERTSEMTDGAIGSLTQRDRFLEHLSGEHDINLLDAQKGTIANLLKRKDLDRDARALLEMRLQVSAASPAKYKAVLSSACSDGRLRGMTQFCGASRTLRDAGRIVQLQNLPRPTLKPKHIERAIEAMKLDCEDLIYENVSEVCVNAVRGCLIAEDDRKFTVADLSNIEGRVAAWLAGEDWKVQAFKDFDTITGFDEKGKAIRKGPDLYRLAYSRSFNIPIDQVIDKLRQIGKVMELAFQFGGALGAFHTMGANYGVELPDEEVIVLVKAWRAAHARIKAMWYDIENAAIRAIRNPDEAFTVRSLRLDMKDGYLRIRTPNGTFLSYADAYVHDTCDACKGTGVCEACEGSGKGITRGALGDCGECLATGICRECTGSGKVKPSVRYFGIDQYTRKWTEIRTWGGKFFENIVQKTARDVFFAGLKRAETKGYCIVVRVHDELLGEPPANDNYTAAGLSKEMATNDSWNIGLPLAAAGHEFQRYAKVD